MTLGARSWRPWFLFSHVLQRRFALIGHSHNLADLVGQVAWATQISGIPARVTDIGNLVDPNADRIVFWDDSAGALTYLEAGAGLQIAGTVLSSTITQYTDEMAQDAVGVSLVDSASVDFTYNDAANTITASVLPAGVDHGGLGGLSDDDHPQYPLAAGTETISGAWTFTSAFVVDFATFGALQLSSATALVQMQIRPDTGNSGFLSFTEDGVADRWVVGIRGGAGNLDFASGSAGANTNLLRLTSGGELQILRDNDELQIGAGQDLRLYHDGTNCFVRADTGHLHFNIGASTFATIRTTGRLQLQNADPRYVMHATGEATNEKEWQYLNSSGDFEIWAATDAGSAAQRAYRITRTGTAINAHAFAVDAGGAVVSLQIDGSTTAGQTRLLVYDVDNATLERVTIGAADSGGVGFKVLRIAN